MVHPMYRIITHAETGEGGPRVTTGLDDAANGHNSSAGVDGGEDQVLFEVRHLESGGPFNLDERNSSSSNKL